MSAPAHPGHAFTSHDHSHCRRDGLARADQVARARGLRMTPVRRCTLEILLQEHRALGAYEVLDRLVAAGFGRQPPVAYRALDFLVENGFAHRVQALNAFIACAHPGEDHQAVFLICRTCSAIAEAPIDAPRAAVEKTANALGFVAERVNIEATGLCPKCRDAA